MATSTQYHPFVRFMAAPAGRWLRLIAGVLIAVAALYATQGTEKIVLVAVGTIVFLAGALNVCLFAPLFRAPFLGSKVSR